MSLESIRVEELNGGLRAAFVHLPHFRTHSARLVISAGSSHETPDVYGGAHFLEHITFQGTEGMPEQKDVLKYKEDNGLLINAFTGKTNTRYIVNGYDLESVGFFVSQVALKPRLTDEALEGERRPILDELRGRASSPYFAAQVAHNKVLRGETFARPIGGSSEDVQNMTPESLRAYYNRHYRLGNALLVISSAAPVEQQREYAQSLVANHVQSEPDEPNHVVYDRFNPDGVSASLHQVDLPIDTQSSMSLVYEVPDAVSVREQLGYNLVSRMLSKAANDKLRHELALSYGAQASINKITDQNFRRNKSWLHLDVDVSLSSDDVVVGLEALYGEVLRQPLAEEALDYHLVSFRRDVDHLMEGRPSAIANSVADVLTSSARDVIVMNELEEFANKVSIDELRKLHNNIVDTPPLVLATSPDQSVLRAAGDWSQSF